MDTYVIFDFETTGLKKQKEIIEIGALKIVDNEIIDTFQSLVKPSIPIPANVQSITGIDDKLVENAPLIKDIIPAFLDFIENSHLIGHNIATFDLPLLRRIIFDITPLQLLNEYTDTLSMAKRKLILENYKLPTIANHFSINTENAHRALNDCYITYECFKQLQQLPDLDSSVRAKTTKRRSKKSTYKKVSNQDSPLYNELFGNTNDFLESHLSSVPFTGFSEKTVCLTGEFDHGNKTEMKHLIESSGGIIAKNFRKDIDILLIGNKGSASWSNGNYGDKIKKAIAHNEKGCHIQIIKEADINF